MSSVRRVVVAVVQPHVDAAAVRIARVVLAVAGPDDGEIAAVVHGHRTVALLGARPVPATAEKVLSKAVLWLSLRRGLPPRLGDVGDDEMEFVAVLVGAGRSMPGFPSKSPSRAFCPSVMDLRTTSV